MTTDRIAECLAYVHQRLDERAIWHGLAYGTLLGAVRQADLIEWDYDFDLFIQPSDRGRVVAMTGETVADGYTFEPTVLPGDHLAVNPGGLAWFSPSAIAVRFHGAKVADLYAFTLFSDGVLRRFDLERDVYWVPHSSFPHFFVDELDTAEIRGETYPVPRQAEQFLALTYGDDWRTPYRAVRQGGQPRADRTIHGDRFEPTVTTAIAWCEAHGWNRDRYRHEYQWPRTIRAAGPIGPTARTADSSGALWWRSRAELHTLY